MTNTAIQIEPALLASIAAPTLADFASLVAVYLPAHLDAGLDMDAAIVAAVRDVAAHAAALKADPARREAIVKAALVAVWTSVNA